MVSAPKYTLCVKIFITFQWLWKHLSWLLSRKRYIFPIQCCYIIGLHNPLIIVSVQGYLMLINRVHLVFLVLKQHLLSVYCFTIKQAGLVVIKLKAFRNHTLFCTFAALFSTSLSIFLYAYILALKTANSVMIFPPSSFIRPITSLFSPMGSGLLSSLEYPLVSNLFFTSFGLYLINKAVSIHVKKLDFAAILWSHVVVMKLIH